mmetsp:Transcript_29644/g.81495  ORF Transcript_29644/g.81495 Transcript_29644/m.81495 type:complete len:226 (-) Transcript_29644:1245-1922(-)
MGEEAVTAVEVEDAGNVIITEEADIEEVVVVTATVVVVAEIFEEDGDAVDPNTITTTTTVVIIGMVIMAIDDRNGRAWITIAVADETIGDMDEVVVVAVINRNSNNGVRWTNCNATDTAWNRIDRPANCRPIWVVGPFTFACWPFASTICPLNTFGEPGPIIAITVLRITTMIQMNSRTNRHPSLFPCCVTPSIRWMSNRNGCNVTLLPDRPGWDGATPLPIPST